MRNSYFQIACNILLIAYGMMCLFGRSVDAAFLLGFLMAVAAAFGSAIPDNRRISVLISLCSILYICFFPAGIAFLPLILYEPFRRKAYLPVPAAAAAVAIHFGGAAYLVFLLIGTGLSFLLAEGTSRMMNQTRSIIDIRDTAAEHRLELEQRNKALREQQDSEIYAATLRERNRIAREIHDNVGHILSRSILMTGALQTVNRDENLKEPLALLETQLGQAMNSIRESVHDLHDESVDLHDSANLLIRDFKTCPVEFTYRISRTVPNPVKYCFLAVLKEALTNVTRHSNATRVTVKMMEHPAIYQLSVRDNGTVIPKRAADGEFREGGGIGLSNMRERVRDLGGNISISAENGFHIFISIPKKNRETGTDPEVNADSRRRTDESSDSR